MKMSFFSIQSLLDSQFSCAVISNFKNLGSSIRIHKSELKLQLAASLKLESHIPKKNISFGSIKDF